MNYDKIKKKDLHIIEKIKQVDINFLSYQKDWKKFEQNNISIVLNALFVPYNSEEINFAYKSKYSGKRKNHAFLVMINQEAEECHYFAVKNYILLNG